MKVKHIRGVIGDSVPEISAEALSEFGLTHEEWVERHPVEEIDVPDIGSSDPVVLALHVKNRNRVDPELPERVVMERVIELSDMKSRLTAAALLLDGKALSLDARIAAVQADIDNLLSSIPDVAP